VLFYLQKAMADTTDGRKFGAEGANLHTIGKRIGAQCKDRDGAIGAAIRSQSFSHTCSGEIVDKKLGGGSTCPVKLDQNYPNYVDPGEEEEEEEEEEGVLRSIDPHTTSTKPFSQRP
jgi:hypothetical protein